MMRRLPAIVLGIALLACCATMASAQRWKYPPGPPYRTCTDTLTLFDVQNPDTLVAPCHPATLDTVYGVRGIITAFDARPSAYGFYIQNSFLPGASQKLRQIISANEAKEVPAPPSPSGGTASGFIMFDRAANTVTYDILATNMSGTVTAAHIHAYASPATGGAPVKIGFTLVSPGRFKGVASYPDSAEANLLAGSTYLNVHTTNNPGGQVRDQLNRYQAPSAQGWTGVDVFTGATNYNGPVPGTPSGGNLALGDSVVVYGTTQEFPASNGETEIEGPDAIQSTDDIIIRKISSGNPLPAFKVGTTHDFNWVPGISAATSEPWEGCLVRINGPLKVARVAQGAGVAGNTFLLVNPSNPADSVLIDGFTLFLFGTPPLGTNVVFVQGILNQRASTAGTGSIISYRIQIRDANDISVAAPPNLVEAYPLEDNQLRLIFDKNLDLATAQNPGNYSLGSGISGSTVDVATLVGGAGTTVELTITSVLQPGDDETVTAQNVGTASCPTCLSPSQTLEFATGITPLYEESLALVTSKGVQAPDPAFLAPTCDDRSRYAGPGTAFGRRITVRGVAVQQYGSLHYIVHPGGGKRRGVSVFGPSQPLIPGHRYRIACRVQEFGGETELVNTVKIDDEGLVAVPAPQVKTVAVLSDTTCDAGQALDTGEDYEGTLVQVNGVEVAQFANFPFDPAAGGSFLVFFPPRSAPGPRDTILVSSLGGNYNVNADPRMIVNVTGVLHFDNNSFRILPRGDADIVIVDRTGVDGGGSLELALRVRPNPGPSHNVSFALPRKGHVELGVYDLAGRRIALIARGVMPAGSYSRVWDGRGADGSRARAGMYFYRLRLGDDVRNTRAILIN